jgi:PKD repeat protein
MRARDIVRLKVLNPVPFDPENPEFDPWVDVTPGLISLNLKTGYDSFDGFWDQPDTGQVSIISQGSSFDPNINDLIKINTVVQIDLVDDVNQIPGQTIQSPFLGFITNIDVEYRKGELQLVTINATDIMGYLNRLVFTQDFIDTEITPTYEDNVVPGNKLFDYVYILKPELSTLIGLIYSSRAFPGYFPNFNTGQEIPNAPLIKVEAGNTFYELMCKSFSSALITYQNVYSQQYVFYPNVKYDPYMNVIDNPLVDAFQEKLYVKTYQEDEWQNGRPNEETDLTFKFIKINDGIDKIINQVSVSNTNPITEEIIDITPVVDSASIETYGPAKLNGTTTFTTTTNPFWLSSSTVEGQALEYQTNIIDYQSNPSFKIESITIDMVSQLNKISWFIPDNNTQFYIQHKINDDTYIAGDYVVSGVSYTIDVNNWFAEFTLRPSEYADYIENRPKKPEISLSATSGTTATSFTASISNYTEEELSSLQKIEWMVNINQYQMATSPPTQQWDPNATGPYGFTMYNVYGPPVPHFFLDETATWTYDDGGLLQNWPEIYYGPGTYKVAVWVTNQDGYTSLAESELIEVTGATAHADFTFTKSASEIVTFYDASGADTNTWEWDFGDGTTYVGQNPPPKQYATGGTYNVRLDVDNGFTTNHIIKPVTINVYQIPVQYVKLRYQGTVTRPAGETEYPVDLIDTIGLLELRNDTYVQTGGIQPFYFGRIGTLEKVQELSKGNGYQYLRILDDPVTRANHFEWIYQSSPLSPTDPNIPYSPWGPNYITDYSSGGPLDPMSQTHLNVWTDNPVRGTACGTVPKYRFIPVITDNEDGSQTKSIDIDINFWYSQTYVTGSKTSSSTSVYRNYRNQRPAGATDASPLGPQAQTYLPAGRLASLAYWNEWGSGFGSAYNQALKLKEVIIWPGMDTKVKKTTAKQLLTIPGGGGATAWFFDPPSDPPLDRFGVQEGKTYLPIEIAVSDDGVTFRKIGEAEYVSGNTLTTTYDVPMPPFSDAPILT